VVEGTGPGKSTALLMKPAVAARTWGKRNKTV
jgi:hypothetical protein